MGDVVFDFVYLLLGGGLADKLSDWMDSIMNAISVIVSAMSTPITVMSGIGCSLMIIYFFMDLTNQASRDMFSFDKLVVAFIRLLVAFAILLYAKELIDIVVDVMKAFKDWMQTSKTWFGDGSGSLMLTEEARSDFQSHYSGIFGAIDAVFDLVKFIIPGLVAWICELVGRFLSASTMVQLMARLILAPLAIVQVFEEGTRSAGIRYIKGLFAEAITFGVMLLILNTAAVFGNTLIAEKLAETLPGTAFNSVAVVDAVGWAEFGYIIISQLICVGGMAGASKIAHDVLGA